MGILNLVKKKRPLEEREDFEKDLYSIMEFLPTIGRDVKEIYDLCIKVKKARAKERSEVDAKKQAKLLEEEIIAWDKFLEKYVMFDRDIDIASARVKKISAILKEEAEQINVSHKVKDMVKKKGEWTFNW